ncbi:MAG: hypothetical protein NTX23_09310 [Candidatus Bipolaricaulota bacterium]|nr:hypothetical protein [Candidatus Bipolaricaulota bacterium]
MSQLLDPLTAMIITSAGIAVMSIIGIAMDNVWGFVIGLLLVLGLVFGGILRYRAKDTETAKYTCLTVTVIGFILGFINLFLGKLAVAFGLIDMLLVIPTGYAWYRLQTGK